MLYKAVGILFVVLFLLISSPHSQTLSYSESVPYEPRKAEEYLMKKERKRKKNKKIPVVAAPVSPPAADNDSKTLTIPVSIFDEKGRFVTGLTKSDFVVFVDNNETDVSAFENAKQQVNVVILIDTSPSTFGVEDIAKYAAEIADTLHPDTKILVAQFSESLKVLSPLTNNRDEMMKGIRKAKIGDGTSLYSVIETFFGEIIPQIPGRTAVLLLTDGVDTTSRNSDYAHALAQAEKSDITIFPVYFDTLNNRPKVKSQSLPPLILSQILASPNLMRPEELERLYEVGKFFLTDLLHLSGGREIKLNDINPGQNGLGEELRQQYYLTFELPDIFVAGHRHPLKVRVNRPNLIVRARGSYISK